MLVCLFKGLGRLACTKPLLVRIKSFVGYHIKSLRNGPTPNKPDKLGPCVWGTTLVHLKQSLTVSTTTIIPPILFDYKRFLTLLENQFVLVITERMYAKAHLMNHTSLHLNSYLMLFTFFT